MGREIEGEQIDIDPEVSVEHLLAERQRNPPGIGERRPMLSWRLVAARRNVRQSAYQVVVATSEAGLRDGDLVWDSGRVESDQSTDVAYDGPDLRSRTRYVWTVRVWTDARKPTGWADPAWWEMGLLSRADWHARWVEPEQRPTVREEGASMTDFVHLDAFTAGSGGHDRLNPAQRVRKSFTLSGDIVRARVYATAHGVYELEINGQRIGPNRLAPEYTTYPGHLMVQTYDVTELLGEGGNALGVTLADGWYAGRLALTGASANWGDRLALLLQLEVTYASGGTTTIASDSGFTSSSDGPVRYADLLIGERYDARQEQPGWSTASFGERWTPVREVEHPVSNLVAQLGEPLRDVDEIAAVRTFVTQTGDTVVDFGENAAGHVRMRVTGQAGTEVTLHHSQTLDRDGNFFENVFGKDNDNTDVYVLRGGGEEVFEPTLTYHGFRYVRVIGYPGPVEPTDFTLVVVSSVDRPSVSFSASDPDLERLHRNLERTLRANLFSIPTDNPDRERAGWTGDLQAIAPTVVQAFPVQSFMARWLRDLAVAQLEDGQVPVVVPYHRGYRETLSGILGTHGVAGWGDAAVLVPWTLHLAYGDRRVLEESYPAAKRWVDWVAATAPDTLTAEDRADDDRAHIWRPAAMLGDWPATSTRINEYGVYDMASGLPSSLAPTMFFARSSSVLAAMATELGYEEDAAHYAEQAAAIRRGFAKAFVTEAGRLTSQTQGDHVLALQFDMVDPSLRPLLVERLVDLIRENDHHIDTGFLSTGYLLPLLADNGHADLAFSILLARDLPSWLYQVDRDATTFWEIFGAVQDSGEVTRLSQMQPAFTSVGDFLYRYIGGIRAASPGYRDIRIQPRVDGPIDAAALTLESPYGPITTSWRRTGRGVELDVDIPAGTTSTVTIPGRSECTTESGRPLREAAITVTHEDTDGLTVRLGSGHYRFRPRTDPTARPRTEKDA